MKVKNFATIRSTLPTVKISGNTLIHRKKVGAEWRDIPIEKPFGFDIPSLCHGWVKFETGTRADFQMQPASETWSDDEAEAMIADGYVFVVTVKISSAEIGGLHELQVTSRDSINAINELTESYLSHPSAALGEIPVIFHQSDEMGNHSFELRGFTKRPPGFGKAFNPIPKPTSEPKPEATKADGNRTSLLATLELRKSQTQEQFIN